MWVELYKKLPNCLSKWLYHLAFPLAVNEGSCCATSLSVEGAVGLVQGIAEEGVSLAGLGCFTFRCHGMAAGGVRETRWYSSSKEFLQYPGG